MNNELDKTLFTAVLHTTTVHNKRIMYVYVCRRHFEGIHVNSNSIFWFKILFERVVEQ